MFVNEVVTSPRYVDGRTFVEKTVNSKFKKGDVSITTIVMDKKPIIKKYTCTGIDRVRHFWKSLLSKETVETTKRLNTLV